MVVGRRSTRLALNNLRPAQSPDSIRRTTQAGLPFASNSNLAMAVGHGVDSRLMLNQMNLTQAPTREYTRTGASYCVLRLRVGVMPGYS